MAEAAPAGDGEEEAPRGRGWVCTGNGGPGMPVGVQCHLGLQLGREAALGGCRRRGVAQAPAFPRPTRLTRLGPQAGRVQAPAHKQNALVRPVRGHGGRYPLFLMSPLSQVSSPGSVDSSKISSGSSHLSHVNR